jgi:hypothetical protein
MLGVVLVAASTFSPGQSSSGQHSSGKNRVIQPDDGPPPDQAEQPDPVMKPDPAQAQQEPPAAPDPPADTQAAEPLDDPALAAAPAVGPIETARPELPSLAPAVETQPAQTEQVTAATPPPPPAPPVVPLSSNPEQRQLQKDTAALLQLAQELKVEIEKAGSNTLSLAALRKVNEIQKLSVNLKERMKVQEQSFVGK